MSFCDIVEKFENEAGIVLQFEVMEKHDSRYLFGSGYAVYRSGGFNFRIVYEGRDDQAIIEISEKHQKYPDCTWETIFTGSPVDLWDSGVGKLVARLTV